MGGRFRAGLAAAALAAACGGDIGGGDGNGVDAAAPDAGAAPDAAPPVATPEVYPTDRTLSPITPFVAANLRAIAQAGAGQNDAVFIKVGASATVSSQFLHCFAGDAIDLDGRDALQATIDFFTAEAWDRDSLAATVGWSAGAALSGDPSPLDDELAAMTPRFAVIMFGTNDIQLGNIHRYGENLLDIADQLIAAGVVPLFTTIMPRDDSADADLEVPRYNAVVRAVAQARQVPLIDYERELRPLPDHGIGGDGIHPTSVGGGCDLTAAGLAGGYNIRNLITLQTLDRMRAVVLDGGDAPDAPASSVAGAGTSTDPIVVDVTALPFVDARDTATSPMSAISVYEGCAATQDESGPEYIYRVEVAEQVTVRALVIDRGDTDIDLHLLTGEPTAGACVDRNDRTLVATLAPGTHYFSLDTFVPSGQPAATGEYLFVLVAE